LDNAKELEFRLFFNLKLISFYLPTSLLSETRKDAYSDVLKLPLLTFWLLGETRGDAYSDIFKLPLLTLGLLDEIIDKFARPP